MDLYVWKTFLCLTWELSPCVLCEKILRGWFCSEVLAIIQRGEDYLEYLSLTVSWRIKSNARARSCHVWIAPTWEGEPEIPFNSWRAYRRVLTIRGRGVGKRDEMEERKMKKMKKWWTLQCKQPCDQTYHSRLCKNGMGTHTPNDQGQGVKVCPTLVSSWTGAHQE